MPAMPPHRRWPGDQGLILADPPSLRAFARTGSVAALLAWSGDRLHVVRDVYLELSQRGEKSGDVQSCLRHLEGSRRLLELSQPGKVWVARVGMMVGGQWIGLLATARMVRELQVGGSTAIALVHGTLAAQLCVRLDASMLETRELLRRMTRSGALTAEQSWRVWLALGLPPSGCEGQLRRAALASPAAAGTGAAGARLETAEEKVCGLLEGGETPV
jgi:hypothetical protein